MFKQNDQVTWGTGSCRARIEDFGTSDEGTVAYVVLTAPVTAPSGQRFPSGTHTEIPLAELRFLQ